MKTIALIVWLGLLACGNDNADQKTATTASTEKKSGETAAAPASGDDITGEWQLVAVTEDKNGNEQLDPEERAAATKMTTDYMKLNSDGTAEILIMHAKGRYEIKKNENSGKNYLTLYSEDNTAYKKGYIMSVNKKELLIMNKFGGDSITIWERV